MALTQISTAGVKDDAVTAGKIPADAIGSSEIAANAVGSSELADNAVDTAAIAADAVTNAKIANDSIDSEHYADGSIDTAHISNDAITGAKIADNAIESEHYADTSIDTAHISNGAVTSAKLASGVQTTINNNADNRVITGSGTANTLEGESKLTFNGTLLKVQDTAIPQGYGAQSGTLLVLEDSGDTQLEIGSGYNNTSSVFFGDTGASNKGRISYHNGTGGDALAFHANDSERMRIDSNGHARFGPSGDGGDTGWNHSAYGNTEVAIDGTGGYAVLHLRGDGAGSTATRFSMGVGDDKFYMCYDDVDARHNIVVSGDGVVSIPVGIELGSGTDATPAGNILDDYEEGTFTPSHSAVTLSGTVVGHYTKIGDLVYVSAIFDVPTTSNTSDVEIHGLPFNAKNGTDGNYIQGGYTIYSNQGSAFNVLLVNNQNTFVVYDLSGQRASMNDFSNKILRLAGVYKVA